MSEGMPGDRKEEKRRRRGPETTPSTTGPSRAEGSKAPASPEPVADGRSGVREDSAHKTPDTGVHPAETHPASDGPAEDVLHKREPHPEAAPTQEGHPAEQHNKPHVPGVKPHVEHKHDSHGHGSSHAWVDPIARTVAFFKGVGSFLKPAWDLLFAPVFTQIGTWFGELNKLFGGKGGGGGGHKEKKPKKDDHGHGGGGHGGGGHH